MAMHEASSMTGVVELTVVRVSGSVDGRAGGGVGRVLGASYLRALRLVKGSGHGHGDPVPRGPCHYS